MAKSILHGVIVYEVMDNQCLSGFWTNNGHKMIMTETARKFSQGAPGLDGSYVCTYIDADKSVYSGTLSIKRTTEPMVYEFAWDIVNTLSKSWGFDGVGFVMNNGQIAVSYIEANRYAVVMGQKLGILD